MALMLCSFSVGKPGSRTLRARWPTTNPWRPGAAKWQQESAVSCPCCGKVFIFVAIFAIFSQPREPGTKYGTDALFLQIRRPWIPHSAGALAPDESLAARGRKMATRMHGFCPCCGKVFIFVAIFAIFSRGRGSQEPSMALMFCFFNVGKPGSLTLRARWPPTNPWRPGAAKW